MFGKMGDMMGMLSELKKAQKKMENLKKEMDKEFIEKSNAHQTISVKVSLSGKVDNIQIATELYNEPENLPSELQQTLNTALEEARGQYEQRLAANAQEGMPDIASLMGK